MSLNNNILTSDFIQCCHHQYISLLFGKCCSHLLDFFLPAFTYQDRRYRYHQRAAIWEIMTCHFDNRVFYSYALSNFRFSSTIVSTNSQHSNIFSERQGHNVQPVKAMSSTISPSFGGSGRPWSSQTRSTKFFSVNTNDKPAVDNSCKINVDEFGFHSNFQIQQ